MVCLMFVEENTRKSENDDKKETKEEKNEKGKKDDKKFRNTNQVH